jgi:putative transposase
VVRSDNGLIFQSRRFRAACRDYRLSQEFITPYTPEQNGIIERFFRSLKEECVWQHNFARFADAREALSRWINWYNELRPHQAFLLLTLAKFWTSVLTGEPLKLE